MKNYVGIIWVYNSVGFPFTHTHIITPQNETETDETPEGELFYMGKDELIR